MPSTGPPSQKRARGAASTVVERSTDVLVALIDSPEVGVSELSRRFGWPKSVVHRILTSLVASQFVALDPGSRRYRLGPTALRLGLAALARADVHRLALPHLRSLRDRTGETATLTLLYGNERLYADQVESPNPVRQTVEIGSRAPLYLGATSKAMLAFLDEGRRQEVMAAARDARRADGSPVDTAALSTELTLIRKRGFATSRGERVPGAASVAAPILGRTGDVIGCMSVAGVTIRQDELALERLGPVVLAEAIALSHELGWSGDRPTG